MLNIVIPMAGAGSRFSKNGFTVPKPLIQINGIPMIRVVINNLKPIQPHRYIFICQNEHIRTYELTNKFQEWAPDCKIVGIDGVTDGAACTVQIARDLVDNDNPLMIANSDQYVDVDINRYLEKIEKENIDGLIMTMKANDIKWSYVGMNEQGIVQKVVEKEIISNEATVGIYNFKKGRDFVKAADAMIFANRRTNNEFYVAPVYNELINWGKKIKVFNIGEEGRGMYGLGIPEDLNKFLENPICIKATKPMKTL